MVRVLDSIDSADNRMIWDKKISAGQNLGYSCQNILHVLAFSYKYYATDIEGQSQKSYAKLLSDIISPEQITKIHLVLLVPTMVETFICDIYDKRGKLLRNIYVLLIKLYFMHDLRRLSVAWGKQGYILYNAASHLIDNICSGSNVKNLLNASHF